MPIMIIILEEPMALIIFLVSSKQIVGDGYTLSGGTIYWVVMTWSSDTVPEISSNGGTSYPTAAGFSRK